MKSNDNSQRIAVILLINFICGCLAVFDAENAFINVKQEGNEIVLVMSENPDVNTVFLSTELLDYCGSEYNIVHVLNKSESANYRHKIPQALSQSDVFRIFGVFETDSKVLTKLYDFKFDKNGNGVKQDKPTETPYDNDQTCFTERKSKVSRTPRRFNKNLNCYEADSNDKDEPRCANQLIFEETFDKPGLDNWKFSIFSRTYSKSFEFPAFVKSIAHTKVEHGHLILTATLNKNDEVPDLTNCTSTDQRLCNHKKQRSRPKAPIFSSIIRLMTQSFKYGRYELRAKVPIGDYLVPCIMLIPNDNPVESQWLEHLRILHVRGHPKLFDNSGANIGGNTLYGSVFVNPYRGGDLFEENRKVSLKDPDAHFGDEFHDYTMIWKKDSIVFKVDGQTYGTITNKDILNKLNDITEYSLVVGLSAGGILNYPNNQVQMKQPFFRMTDPKAPLRFSESIDNPNFCWKQPHLQIDHIKIYTTD